MSKISSMLRGWLAHLRIRRAERRSLKSDTHLVAQLTRRRFPTLAQWKYLPRSLTPSERVIMIVGILVLLASAGTLSARFYLRATIVVPKTGGTYTEALVGAPRFVNPIIAQTNDVDLDLSRLLFSGLFRHTETLALEPDLVKTYTVSDDEKTYTLTLNEGLHFDNGEPLTSRDVLFTINAIQDPEWRSPLEPTLRGVTADAVDDTTIELALTEPFAPLLDNLTFGILPEHVWADITPSNVAFADENLRPIGSGPFRVESFTKNNDGVTQYTLVRNPYFHRTPSYVDRIIFKFFPDAPSALDALKNKQVDGFSATPRHIGQTLDRERRIASYTLKTPQYLTVFFSSTSDGVLGDAKTRTALALAIDRLKVLDAVFSNRGELALGTMPKGSLGYDASLSPILFDIRTAQTALKEAGWKELARDGYTALWEKQERERREKIKENKSGEAGPASPAGRPGSAGETEKATEKQSLPPPALDQYWEKNNTILTVTLTTIDYPELTETAAFLKQSWEALGVPTEVVIVPPSRLSKDVLQPRAYQALLTNILIGADPNPYALWHSSQRAYPGFNLAQFESRELDTLLEEARKSVKIEERTERYKKIQVLLRDAMPAFIMINPWYAYAIDQSIRGVVVDRMTIPADRFATITSWYVKTKRVWK